MRTFPKIETLEARRAMERMLRPEPQLMNASTLSADPN
jgi:hypothetical protein